MKKTLSVIFAILLCIALCRAAFIGTGTEAQISITRILTILQEFEIGFDKFMDTFNEMYNYYKETAEIAVEQDNIWDSITTFTSRFWNSFVLIIKLLISIIAIPIYILITIVKVIGYIVGWIK